MIVWMLAANAWALSWWVPDASTADALTHALATSWPGAPVDVQIGPPPGDVPALAYAGGALVLTGAHPRRQEAPSDWTTLVLLARTWAAEASDEAGWIPDPPVVTHLPDPVPAEIPVPRAPRAPPPPWTWGLGIGVREAWQDSTVWSPRLVGRVARGPFAGEFTASFATTDWLHASSTDRTLTEIAELEGAPAFTSRADVSTFAGLFSVAPARWDLHRWSFCPFASLGLELRNTVERTFTPSGETSNGLLTVNVTVDPTSTAFAGGPLVNGGFEVALTPVSLRLGVAYGTGGGSAFLDILVSP